MGVKKRSVRIWSWMLTSMRVNRANPDPTTIGTPICHWSTPALIPSWQLPLFCDMIVLP
ncbi:hypothetical protein [Paenibacillus sp. An7]|uniref:hypothetical protein n=1 Tax=Paenibacillus sp. An7 TaxID=2689577 RepID=UPI0013594538|nr:hypothetical protein [Paenibacillus sp. An7]